GSLNAITEPARASSHPTASFTYSPATPHVDEQVTLDASESTDSDGSIIQHSWDIETDDGYIYETRAETTTYTWDTAGDYDVTLTVEDDGGNTDSTSKTIDIVNESPIANFGFQPQHPVPDEEVTLDGASSSDPDGSVTQYDWQIETSSGYIYEDTGETTTHSWDTDGRFGVTLTVTDNGGKTSSISNEIIVTNTPPTAEFTYTPHVPNVGEEVTLDGSGSSDPDGSIRHYLWEIETGSGYTYETTGETETFSWDSDGKFAVTLTITDNGGKEASVTKKIYAGNDPPTAEFTWSPSAHAVGEPISFNASASSDPEENIETYEWEFGDQTKRGMIPIHSYGTSGQHDVKLTVIDSRGATDTVTQQLTVGNLAPTASISYYPSRITTETSVEFDGTESSDPDGSIASYTWSFPDGSEITGATVKHQFDNAGEQNVTLTVTDNGGRTATMTITVDVQAVNTNTAGTDDTPTSTTSATTTTTTTTSTPIPAAGNQGNSGPSLPESERLFTVGGALGIGGVGAIVYHFFGSQLVTAITGGSDAAASTAAATVGTVSAPQDGLPETAEELETLLTTAEEHLQTAITNHAQRSISAARYDYKQACDKYSSALDTLSEQEHSSFDFELKIVSSSRTDPLPSDFAEWPNLDDNIRETLSQNGIE
ncbi:MAG: PKD domain-containing protein, partial [Halobacteriaceae archaeon]